MEKSDLRKNTFPRFIVAFQTEHTDYQSRHKSRERKFYTLFNHVQIHFLGHPPN